MTARTRWMFGFQRRLVRRWECETFMPNDGFLPQISQTDAMVNFLLFPSRCSVQAPVEPNDHCSIASNDLDDDAVRWRTARSNLHLRGPLTLA